MAQRGFEHVVIIGGGVGGAIAHDLTLRGFRVTLVERGEITSGATGRHHGLLHSGARYALHDVATARECRQESLLLQSLAPDALEMNGGLFVGISDLDRVWLAPFREKCAEAGIPTRQMDGHAARTLAPNLSQSVSVAVAVPDATMDAYRFALHFFATARAHGAVIRSFCEATGIRTTGHGISGVDLLDHRRGKTEFIGADLVVNAAGAWAGQVAAMAGVQLPIQPGPGVMVSVAERLAEPVINRLQPADEGDIIVPQRNLSILGTTAWLVDDPDAVEVPADHVTRLREMGARLIPKIHDLPIHATWSACRPLVKSETTDDPMKMSREFTCIDHGDRDGVTGLVSVIGGKATTMRAMAETVADRICNLVGRQIACRTKTTPLRPYREYFNTTGGHP